MLNKMRRIKAYFTKETFLFFLIKKSSKKRFLIISYFTFLYFIFHQKIDNFTKNLNHGFNQSKF
jgi:hypothetical protein